MTGRPAATMVPQDMTFASPRPKNARPASVRTALATITDAITMTEGKQFGRISVKMIRAGDRPMRRQDDTNSRPPRVRNSLRTKRAIGGQDAIAIALIIVARDGCRITM